MSENHWEARLERIEEKLEHIPTKEDLEAVIHVQEVAAASLQEKTHQVDDKSESGYVVLESLFKGMENRVAAMIQESEQRLTERMDHLDERVDRIDQNVLQMGKVLEMVAQLNQKQDERLTHLEVKMDQMVDQISALTDITRAWIYKGNLIEKEVQELKRRMGDE
ncbi:hypothetical protein [Laceyella putida]|uniref:Uncharacterized protein n=1 Tax=Laceyella putida TaxID=110101 RepID=A0ABW2RKB1_9BACL